MDGPAKPLEVDEIFQRVSRRGTVDSRLMSLTTPPGSAILCDTRPRQFRRCLGGDEPRRATSSFKGLGELISVYSNSSGPDAAKAYLTRQSGALSWPLIEHSWSSLLGSFLERSTEARHRLVSRTVEWARIVVGYEKRWGRRK